MRKSGTGHRKQSGRVRLSEDERTRLRRALAEAELLTDEDGWDSLDLVSALTVAEYELGIWLDETQVRPGDLLDVEGLAAAIEAHGVRLATGARLRLDISTPEKAGPGEERSRRERERRQLEYRLALTSSEARFAVSRGSQLAVFACVSDPAHLPVQAAFARAAGWPCLLAGQAPPSPPALAMSEPPRGEAAGRLIERVERQVQALVTRRGGVLWAPASPLITLAALRQLGYYQAHPEQIVQLDAQLALLPAACLNSYPLLATAGPVTLGTHLATVFRREARYDRSTGRLPAFTCREILWCAEHTWEEAFTYELEGWLAQLADELGIRGDWVTAHDPFFLADQAAGCKREFRARTSAGEIAIASVNRHGDHFISRGYGQAGRVTGCAGLGLERWALAAGSL